MTNYDVIAEEYKQSKTLPWRTYVEKFTLMHIVGFIEGQSVVDLACGEGYYTRLLQQCGVAAVSGVDISEGMIELAVAEERSRPRGIEYRVKDISELGIKSEYDLAFAAWLLNYAADVHQLARMCKSIVRSLKPGGRFVTINTNPDDPISNFQMGKKHGFVKRAEIPIGDSAEIREGTPIIWTLSLPAGKEINITNYHLSRQTVTNTLLESGFREVNWHQPQIDPDAIQSDGKDHWQPFIDTPPFAFLECFI